MSYIDEEIQKLVRKKAKIEFLNHILNSVIDYNQEEFADVQQEVVKIMTKFTQDKTEEIINGTKPQTQKVAQAPANPMNGPKEEAKPVQNKPDPNIKPSIQEQASFALANRELSGKQVVATNAQGGEARGEVVGLDCPNVVIKTKEGAFIKAPRERIREV